MLALSKKVDYALLSLSYLLDHRGRISSARAIAESHDLPVALLMNILKSLHQSGILCSERGVKGGYQICANLDTVSLYDLMKAVGDVEDRDSPVARRWSSQPPLRALQYKLMSFLKTIRLSDLVIAGRRIDVPVEFITTGKCRCQQHDANLPNEANTAVTA